MLFADIKSYLIELEAGEDESYLNDLEDCSSIDQLIVIFSEYKGVDEYEGSRMLFDYICK